jgi:hypothetical protein
MLRVQSLPVHAWCEKFYLNPSSYPFFRCCRGPCVGKRQEHLLLVALREAGPSRHACRCWFAMAAAARHAAGFWAALLLLAGGPIGANYTGLVSR